MIRRPPRSTLSSSSAASDVYKRQVLMKANLPRHRARSSGAPRPPFLPALLGLCLPPRAALPRLEGTFSFRRHFPITPPRTPMAFELPKLPYAYDALQPYMSKETLEY